MRELTADEMDIVAGGEGLRGFGFGWTYSFSNSFGKQDATKFAQDQMKYSSLIAKSYGMEYDPSIKWDQGTGSTSGTSVNATSWIGSSTNFGAPEFNNPDAGNWWAMSEWERSQV